MEDSVFKRLHCLIVDDHTKTLRSIDAMLRALGVSRIATARNGAEALMKLDLAKSAVDCILSRLWMPEGNGLQLLKAIRSGQTRSTRVDACFILFSPTADPDAVKVAAGLDAHGVLVKPITAEKLRRAIHSGRARYFAADMARYTAQAVPQGRPPTAEPRTHV